ncbi:hypothetical protein MPDQ_007351 [Monascus purpureus]|uniref:ATPase inhibitor, mitochondrial n=1 Tax=Monascus purpureus TaxID=5098 RepID=A0A507QSA8_MONPU|nr:hypothetical protein MPDQ_007351 [Monascus purpureus]BDD55775.1 hypothetical protein MAP00_001262 [Monascus purpureus]
MIRSAASRPLLRTRPAIPALTRAFSSTLPVMAEGDTGAPKSRGSLAASERDSFNKREAAAEAIYIRQHEMEKLKQLQEKLKAQQKHMEELDKHLEEITKGQGGELN